MRGAYDAAAGGRARVRRQEIWLLFENQHGKFPLYPGETAWIDYSYSVGEHKWGQWFQRAIRPPTDRLSVRIELPAALEPALWGTQTTMTAEAVPPQRHPPT